MHKQRGTVVVEFALVCSIFLLLLFAIIEFARVMFIYNALAEGTRRGVRLAAVCKVTDSAVIKNAVILAGNGNSPISSVLTNDQVMVSYLNKDGVVISDPSNLSNFPLIRYVRVEISNFQHELLIPLIPPFTNWNISVPSFSVTIPSESLGYSPTQDAFVSCQS